MGVALLLLLSMASAAAPDPFAWLQPAVTIDAAARARIEQGEVMVRVLPAVDASGASPIHPRSTTSTRWCSATTTWTTSAAAGPAIAA